MAYSQIDATVAAAIGRERRNNRIQLAVVALGLLLVQAAFSGGAPSAVGSSGEDLAHSSRRLLGNADRITVPVIIPTVCSFPTDWFCTVFSYNTTTKTLAIKTNLEVRGTSTMVKPVSINDKASIFNSLYVGQGTPFGGSTLTPGKLELLGITPDKGGVINSQAPNFPIGPTVAPLLLGASSLQLDTDLNGVSNKKVA